MEREGALSSEAELWREGEALTVEEAVHRRAARTPARGENPDGAASNSAAPVGRTAMVAAEQELTQ